MAATLDGIVLLGYMEKTEAIKYLQETCWFDPQVTEQQAGDLWEKYHIAVQNLPERKVEAPARLLIPSSAKNWVDRFMQKYRGPEVLSVINIDPRRLVIYQFYVAITRSDHHTK